MQTHVTDVPQGLSRSGLVIVTNATGTSVTTRMTPATRGRVCLSTALRRCRPRPTCRQAGPSSVPGPTASAGADRHRHCGVVGGGPGDLRRPPRRVPPECPRRPQIQSKDHRRAGLPPTPLPAPGLRQRSDEEAATRAAVGGLVPPGRRCQIEQLDEPLATGAAVISNATARTGCGLRACWRDTHRPTRGPPVDTGDRCAT